MALPIVIPADFVGSVKIAQQAFNTDVLLDYITEFEEVYLRRIFTDLQFNEIVAQNPLEQKYLDAINGVTWIDTDGDTHINDGVKDFLLKVIYFEYVKDNFINTVAGNVQNFNENSDRSTDTANEQIVFKRYNQGVGLYRDSIFKFLDFHEKLSNTVTSSVDNTGTYTLGTASTLYLENTDIVTIGSTEYAVSNVVADTSFDITEATAGLDFTGDTYTYEPFKDIENAEFKYAWL